MAKMQKKKKDQKELNRDLISNLPKEILSRIISLLPFESAVKTSLLSSQWKNHWKLTLEEYGDTIEDAIDSVSKYFNDFDKIHAPRKNWGLKFNYGNGNFFLLAAGKLDSLTKTLHLDFSATKPNSSSLFEHGWSLEMNMRLFPFPRNWCSLMKSVHLMSVPYLSKETVTFIMTKFPLIEKLTISKCNQLMDLVIVGRLLFSLTILDCPKLKHLRVCGSTDLSCFRFRGLLPEFNHGCEFPKLGDVMLDFRQGPGFNHDIDIDRFIRMQNFSTVSSLTLCRWVFETLIFPKLGSSAALGCFGRLKHLWWIDYSEHGYNSDVLICFLRHCPNMERLYVTIDPKSYRTKSKYRCSEKDDFCASGRFKLNFVKLEGFANEEEVMALARRLEKVFSVDPLILVKSHWSSCLQFLSKLFDEENRKFPYKFEDVKDVNDTYNTAHMAL